MNISTYGYGYGYGNYGYGYGYGYGDYGYGYGYGGSGYGYGDYGYGDRLISYYPVASPTFCPTNFPTIVFLNISSNTPSPTTSLYTNGDTMTTTASNSLIIVLCTSIAVLSLGIVALVSIYKKQQRKLLLEYDTDDAIPTTQAITLEVDEIKPDCE